MRQILQVCVPIERDPAYLALSVRDERNRNPAWSSHKRSEKSDEAYSPVKKALGPSERFDTPEARESAVCSRNRARRAGNDA